MNISGLNQTLLAVWHHTCLLFKNLTSCLSCLTVLSSGMKYSKWKWLDYLITTCSDRFESLKTSHCVLATINTQVGSQFASMHLTDLQHSKPVLCWFWFLLTLLKFSLRMGGMDNVYLTNRDPNNLNDHLKVGVFYYIKFMQNNCLYFWSIYGPTQVVWAYAKCFNDQLKKEFVLKFIHECFTKIYLSL